MFRLAWRQNKASSASPVESDLVATLRSSGLVDPHFYRDANPDVAVTGLDPVEHYAATGAREARNPNPFFDAAWYLGANPDVRAAGLNPLLHYILRGADEGRSAGPDFDTAYYVAQNPEVKSAGQNPLLHYIRQGRAEGRIAAPVGEGDAFEIGVQARLQGTTSPLAALFGGARADLGPIARGAATPAPEVARGVGPVMFGDRPSGAKHGPDTRSDAGRVGSRLTRWTALACAILPRLRQRPAGPPSSATDPDPALSGPSTAPAPDATAAYRLWIATVENRGRTPALPRPAELAGALRYSFLLPDAAEPEAVARTLRSIVAQDAPHWELLMPASAPALVRHAVTKVSAEAAERVAFVDCAGAEDRGAVLDRLLAAVDGGWIAVLGDGDILAPQALDAFDAMLARHPRSRIVYSDEDEIDAAGQRARPLFKPEYAPQQLQTFNYFGRLTIIRHDAAVEAGGFTAADGAAAEWSLNLRGADAAMSSGGEVRRIPRVLCHRDPASFRDRRKPGSEASIACERMLVDYWRGLGIRDPRVVTEPDGTQRSTWRPEPAPLVSVIVPNHDNPDLLRVCAEGVLDGTDYPRIELVIVDDRSKDPETLRLYRDLAARPNVKVIRVDTPFNYSAACNRGAEAAMGDLLLFAVNAIRVVDPGWLGELVRVAMLPFVGVVTTRSSDPAGGPRPTGVAPSDSGSGRVDECDIGLFASPDRIRNCLAATGACQMVRRETFDAVGGFDETYELAFSDVALGMQAWKAGWRNAYTPFARLAQNQGKTRGFSNPPQDTGRITRELDRTGITEDPYFHPELTSHGAVPRFLVEGEQSPRALLHLLQRQLAAETARPDRPLDLADTAAIEDATGLMRDVLFWPPQSGAAIADRLGAARFLIDLVRTRSDLRLRFPRCLTSSSRGAFATWLATEGRRQFALTGDGLAHLHAVLDDDPSRAVRQYLMLRDDVRSSYPLGFLPIQRHHLLKWVLREATPKVAFALEAVWWLFLSCAEDPAAELVRTYQFMPDWQRAHPYGLTIFGRARFAAWLVERYALSTEDRWLDPSTWPVVSTPAEQVRLAYDGRHDWRILHPDALASEAAAETLLRWLAVEDGGLSEEARAWCAERLSDGTAAAVARPGVNVIGHFCLRSGLRVSVEAMSDAMETAGLLVSRRDMRTYEVDDPHHIDFDGREIHDVTVIHIQPEPFFGEAYPRADIAERQRRTHRVAYWYWELDKVPDHWGESARDVDELWTATNFVADALRAVTDRPVHTLFPGVRLAPFTRRSRAHFGLPAREDGRFAFLFSFHMDSVMERKNPLGLIASFRLAFEVGEPVDLVLKTTSFGNHDSKIADLREAAGDANVHILDRVLDGDDITALTESCDAYVSLHRSEGLGLTMAEAMLLGKPVVATRYSGNLDFMDDGNSLLVDCDIVPVTGTVPPYTEVPGARWAEPSVVHAAGLMRRVYDDPSFRAALGQRAKASAERTLSPEAAGRRFAERVMTINRSKGAR